jgi:hypothetical protein
MVLTKKIELTTEAILKHVTEFDIIQAFWPAGKELKFDKGAIESPFRNDRTPSFLIGERDNHIIYKDLGAIDIKGDVWKFVEQMENCDFHTALRKIDKWFNLGYTTGNVIEGKPKEIAWQQPVQESRKPTLLQVTVRKFNNEELRYWSEYHQDISDLKRENIYAPAGIWRNRKKLDINQLTFCYFCEDIAKWKIYRPYAGKRAKDTPPNEWKWDNSIGSLQYVENIQSMVGDIGILGKSRKDRLVLMKALGISAICSVQAEDPSALTDETLYQIWSGCRRKYIVADSDQKGKEFSWHMDRNHGYKHCNVPDKFLEENINDFADYARVYGLDAVLKHFQKKKIV